MRPGRWWLVLLLPPLAAVPRGAHEEAAALAAPRCKSLKEMDLIKTSVSDCYCYNQNHQVEWMYMLSTVQVKITSLRLLSIVYITERHNCQYPETILSFIKCVLHNFWTPKESCDLTIGFSPYGETVCFSVEPAREKVTYTIRVHRNIVDFKLLLAFVAGIFLYFSAKTLSQSAVFYYCSGTVLGITMTLVFILLMIKRYIPKYSTFGALMIGCCFTSVYVVCQLMEDLKWLLCENRVCVLAYVLVVGTLSFAACYSRGPLADDSSRGLLVWALQLLSLVLIYAAVAVPQVAFTVMILLLFSRSLRYPCRAVSYMWRSKLVPSPAWWFFHAFWDNPHVRKTKPWLASEPPVVKYLTEDEFKEQAEAETTSALEELRQACRGPDFPSWLAVSRLRAPKRFADFVLGANHVSPEEIRAHDQQYGLGSPFLEEQLFSLQTDSLPAS